MQTCKITEKRLIVSKLSFAGVGLSFEGFIEKINNDESHSSEFINFLQQNKKLILFVDKEEEEIYFSFSKLDDYKKFISTLSELETK